MSVHISAGKGEIAKTVLLPGDPLRAKYIAENYLENPKLVSNTRGILYFTGIYKGKEITVGASGMGCPSVGIYSYELFMEYNVDNIIRIGTCGAYTSELKVYDILNADQSASESTYAKYAWEIDDEILSHQGNIFESINTTGKELSLEIKPVNIHCSDIFYRKGTDLPAVAAKYNCLAVEMESFALFANALYTGKNAATILTVSDVIPTGESISADKREKTLRTMMELALETGIKL